MSAVSGRLRRKLALPGAVVGLSLLGADVVVVSSWRWAPTTVAFILSGLLIAASWLIGRRLRGDRRWLEHLSAFTLVVAAGLLLIRHQENWWPCVACDGGRGYEYLGTTPVVKIAFFACVALQAALASCHLWTKLRADQVNDPPTPAWIQAFVWAMIGGSAFYLMTSVRLGIACEQCLAFHTAVLVLIGPLRVGNLRVFTRVTAMATGFLLLVAAYGTALRVDLEAPLPDPHVATPPDDTQRAWENAADAGRKIGTSEATSTLELGIDFQCPHCADMHDKLMRALAESIADGRVRVVVRHVVRAFEPASPSLARWAFAASAGGRHHSFVSAMLGSRPGATAEEIARGPAGQAVDADALQLLVDAHAAAATHLVETDKAKLIKLRFVGRTPLAVLEARDGRELGRWSGVFDAAAVVTAIATADSAVRRADPPLTPR